MPKLTPVIIPTKDKGFFSSMWAVITGIREYDVAEDWYYRLPNGLTIVIPEGFRFDGASVPKPIYFLSGILVLLTIIGVTVSPMIMSILMLFFLIAGIVMQPTGILLVAGLIHDFAYRYEYIWALDVKGNPYKYKWKHGGRKSWDDLFYRVNIQVNGVIYVDYIAAFVLKLFGSSAWNDNREKNAQEIKPKGKNEKV